MRYAYCKNDAAAPLGVEPNPMRDEIAITSYNNTHIIPVNDAKQLAELRLLLDEAEEILGWERVEIEIH
jgi:hypothetical protein